MEEICLIVTDEVVTNVGVVNIVNICRFEEEQ
jgi:hypothetical protein